MLGRMSAFIVLFSKVFSLGCAELGALPPDGDDDGDGDGDCDEISLVFTDIEVPDALFGDYYPDSGCDVRRTFYAHTADQLYESSRERRSGVFILIAVRSVIRPGVSGVAVWIRTLHDKMFRERTHFPCLGAF